VIEELKAITSAEFVIATAVDIRSREAIVNSINATVAAFGGLDILINTAAFYPSSTAAKIPDALWAPTLDINITANYLLSDEAAKLFKEQALDGSIVLTSSANAVVSKHGSEAYDVSKAAVSHLVRELAVALAPRVRVNGITPATASWLRSTSTKFRLRIRTLTTSCAICSPPFTPSARLLTRPSIPLTARKPSCFWPAHARAAPPATSFPWTAVSPRLSCGRMRALELMRD